MTLEPRLERSEYGFQFLTSFPGVFKVSEAVCSSIALMCSEIFTSSWTSNVKAIIFFKIILILGLIYSVLEMILHVAHVVRKFEAKFTRKYDCIFCIFASIFLFSTTTSIIQYTEKPVSLNAAIAFGFIGALFFAFNAVLRVKQL